ncbi:MAG: DUF1877 family protein [Nannocystales bacterium]
MGVRRFGPGLASARLDSGLRSARLQPRSTPGCRPNAQRPRSLAAPRTPPPLPSPFSFRLDVEARSTNGTVWHRARSIEIVSRWGTKFGKRRERGGRRVASRRGRPRGGDGEWLSIFCDVVSCPPERRNSLRPWQVVGDERAVFDDAVQLVQQNPGLLGGTCDLDRSYDAIAYVLARHVEDRAAGDLLERACRGGDALGEATGCQGFLWRWLSRDEARAVAGHLASIDSTGFSATFASCWHEMRRAGVYKAWPENSDPAVAHPAVRVPD